MFKKAMVGAALITLSLVWLLPAQDDAQTVINNSMKAMGFENLKSIIFAGEGWDGCVGQSYSPNARDWRPFGNRNYVRSVDFEAKGWRMQRTRTDMKGNTGGCSAGPYADQQQNTVTTIGENANFNNQVEYAMLPMGFLQMAAANRAAVRRQGGNTTLTFPLANGQNMVDVTGTINRQGYVERVETKIYNAGVFGDMVWEATFSDWEDYNGVKWPTHIAQSQGGLGFFDLRVDTVNPNGTVDLTPPAGKGKGGPGGAKGGAPGGAKGGPGGGKGGPGGGKGKGGPPPNIVEDLGGNAWLITGGYAAFVVEMSDHVIIAEGTNNDARSAQVLAEARRLVPNKPVRYVINTHHHSDHSGGLRYMMAEGITIMAPNSARGYFDKVYNGVHTLGQDALAQKNPKPAMKLETFGDRKIISDAMNTIEIHKVQNSTHAEGMVIVYLPKQKAVIEADEFNVGGAAPTAPPDTVNPYHSNLLANFERLRLDIDRIVPVHLPGDGRKVTMAELRTMAGRPN